ncbi:MAG: carbohydrate porin [Myxococcota bacterium]
MLLFGGIAEAQSVPEDTAVATPAEAPEAPAEVEQAEADTDATNANTTNTNATDPSTTDANVAIDDTSTNQRPWWSGNQPDGVARSTAAPSSQRADEPTPAADAADSEPEDEDDTRPVESGFAFGSYGRLVAASNLDGGLGRTANIVAFAPRIDEDVYMELELRRTDVWTGGLRSRVVATVAFGGPFFHLDGNFDESIAVRNLYAAVENALVDGLELWAGSRMWRGDDVYLLNFWPLDNINALGGGATYRWDAAEDGFGLDVATVVGLTRLDDPFQRQVDGAIPIDGFLPADVVVLDRPRTTLGLKVTGYPFGRRARTGLKFILYGEGHFIAEGTREVEVGVTERLPQDGGYVLGGQIGGWMADSNTFINLFFKWGRGLGAYNPLGVPFREGRVQDTERAREILIALSANYETGPFGLQLGAYYRNFRDADPSLFERTRLAEGVVNVRPHVWIGQRAGLSWDLSYQALQANQLDERTGQVVRGGVTKLGFIPFYSPFGRGTYTRPHLRLIYSLTLRDADAQRLYPEDDPRSRTKVEHFLGIGAEWWFDSSSYGQ